MGIDYAGLLIRAIALVIGCNLSMAMSCAQAQTSYKVSGIKLGDDVTHNALYKKYKCSESELFRSFTWCRLNSSEKGEKGPYSQTRSMLHSPDGRAHYLSKFIAPAIFEPGEIDKELAHLSKLYGGSPKIINVHDIGDGKKGIIGLWGSINIDQIDNKSRAILASGAHLKSGFLVDYLDNFEKSAQLGAPIYFLSGGPGLIWVASHDQQGRGTLRITAFDDHQMPIIRRAGNPDNKVPDGPSNGENRKNPENPESPKQSPITIIKRIALVVGNSNYANFVKLKNPKNDAEDITQALREIGFYVFSGFDLSKDDMGMLIKQFSFRLHDAEVALVYFAGHGVQKDGKNYLIPVDAKIDSELSLDTYGIQLASIHKQLEQERGQRRLNIVILDACRDNPIPGLLQGSTASRSIGTRSGLAREDVGLDTLFVFSTNPDNVALDGEGRNSPFAEALLQHIKTPNLDIEIMLRNVFRDVQKNTQGQQIPWKNGSMTEGIELAATNDQAPRTAPRVPEPLPPLNPQNPNPTTGAIVNPTPRNNSDDSYSQDKCDELAANPYDNRKPSSVIGVTHEALRFHAVEAIGICARAAQLSPGDARYVYQQARALQINQPADAIPLFDRLMKEGYPAAFDNYGWIMLDRRLARNDVPAATAAFRRGAQLGDSSSMVSLASLIIKGYITPSFQNEHIVLLEKASALGHYEAQQVLLNLRNQLEQSGLQQQQNEEAARMFLGIVGGMMGNAMRR